jgi:hypothetical protein
MPKRNGWHWCGVGSSGENVMSDASPLTPQESERLEWCLSILEDENVAECQDEATEVACKEFYGAKAYEELLPLLVKIKLDELSQERTSTRGGTSTKRKRLLSSPSY